MQPNSDINLCMARKVPKAAAELCAGRRCCCGLLVTKPPAIQNESQWAALTPVGKGGHLEFDLHRTALAAFLCLRGQLDHDGQWHRLPRFHFHRAPPCTMKSTSRNSAVHPLPPPVSRARPDAFPYQPRNTAGMPEGLRQPKQKPPGCPGVSSRASRASTPSKRRPAGSSKAPAAETSMRAAGESSAKTTGKDA